MWGEMGSKKPGEVVLYLHTGCRVRPKRLLKGNGWLRSCLTQRQVSEASRFLMREAAAERGIETEKLHDNWKQGTKR